MSKTTLPEAPIINTFGVGTEIEGDINTNGDLRIDGQLKGKLTCKGKLVIGPTGIVEGEIECRNGDFSGVVKATIMVSELLVLKGTVKVTGDITVGKLAIQPGASFNGRCSMVSQAPPSNGK